MPRTSVQKLESQIPSVAMAPPASPKSVPVRKPFLRPTRFIHIDAGNVESAAPTT